MYRSGINARVLVNGRPVREYQYNGLSFVEARQGTSYSIKVSNDNGYRVMAVVSVDGVDVVTGKPAETAEVGYIVDAFSTIEIKGYRVNNAESAAFLFTAKEGSYVAQMSGNASNTGVIGCRVFKEVEKPAPKQVAVANPWGGITGSVCRGSPRTYGARKLSMTPEPQTLDWMSVEYSQCSSDDVFASTNVQDKSAVPYAGTLRSLDASTFDTGTTWGSKQADKVKEVTFERGAVLCEMSLYYASREALESAGVDFSETPKVASTDALPKAFGSTYCQPPTGWRG